MNEEMRKLIEDQIQNLKNKETACRVKAEEHQREAEQLRAGASAHRSGADELRDILRKFPQEKQ